MMKPLAALLPNTVYEVLDQRTIPCPSGGGDAGTFVGCDPGLPAVFASFTTGTATDTTAPQFSGASALTLRPFASCSNYTARPFEVAWVKAQDDLAGDAVLYNLYQVGVVTPRASYLPGTSALLAAGCYRDMVLPRFIQATVPKNYTGRNQSASFYVRAVDWAGNEDTNQVEVTVTDPCLGAPAADAGEPIYPNTPQTDAGDGGPMDAPVDAPDPADAGADVATDGNDPCTVDAPRVDTSSVDVSAGVDAAADATTGPLTDDDGCSVSPGDASDGAGGVFGAIGLLLLALARRRRR